MLVSTRGIVLNTIKYKETSLIVHIYTEALGLKSYIVNGVRDKKNKASFFQPLSLLDLVVYQNPKSNLNRISQYTFSYAYQGVYVNPIKISILIFIAEVLIKTLKEEHQDEELFDFLSQEMVRFDQLEEQVENFHLHFLIQYAFHLGIKPNSYQELEEEMGLFSADVEVKKLANQLLSEENTTDLIITTPQRRVLVELLIKYYEHHFPFVGKFQSAAILAELYK
jgi:DNA repair protein RecO (recombination protein O)